MCCFIDSSEMSSSEGIVNVRGVYSCICKTVYHRGMRTSAKITGGAILLLFALSLGIWYTAFRVETHGLLKVSFLDIGQGDSIFITAPSGAQMLVDGGPGSKVLEDLSQEMPQWDRSIDVVLATHPDADHVGGLIEVLRRYRVGMVIESSVEGDTATWKSFQDVVEKSGARVVVAHRGQVLNLGKGARVEILFPDRLVPHVETNDGSIVARVVYGNTSFMLTGDAPRGVENYLVRLDGVNLHADVLKAGHHGSKYSSGPLFLGFVDPAFGVFSRGCTNRYGHPAPEIVARFNQFGIPTDDTCKEGTVTFVSDGKEVLHK